MTTPMHGSVAATPIAAVLFDLDGTLIDSAPDLAAAAEHMRAVRGLPPLPLERYRPMASAGARGMLGVAFGIDPSHPDYPPLRDEFFDTYERALTERTRVFDGVAELIDALVVHALPWGVVTNKIARFTDPLTRQMPLFSSAQAIVSGDTTPHPKPHPAPLLEAARRLGVAPTKCVYVGDDERDMLAGRAAGMRTVAARYGYLGAQADVSQWPADLHVDSPQQLLKWLTKA